MGLNGRAVRRALADFLAARAGADSVRVLDIKRFGGGAIQENYALEIAVGGGPYAGVRSWVLRTDPPSGLPLSLSRAQEFVVMETVFTAGVKAPKPLWLCQDPAVLGKPFFIMERVRGSACPQTVVRRFAGDALAEQLGAALATLHTIKPPQPALEWLTRPPSPALARIACYRDCLDALPRPEPVLEWGLRRLELNAPRTFDLALCHGDFRTGNYLVDHGTLTAVLDWEFAAWSEPMEDLGWFCARYWRFGQHSQEAGGIGSREAFCRGYEMIAGRRVARRSIAYWELMANVRWAVIALLQGRRRLPGGRPALDLALTGRRVPEIELDILTGIERLEQETGAYA